MNKKTRELINSKCQINLTTIDEFLLISNKMNSWWIYRGQADSNWELTTGVERVFGVYHDAIFNDYSGFENEAISEFSRKYRLYTDQFIKEQNKFEFLALMQHYGAPTRLLDFSFSFYIASYFACIQSNKESAIWSINLIEHYPKTPKIHVDDLSSLANDQSITHANQFIGHHFLQREEIPLDIIKLVPENYSERLNRQQGLFLMPVNSKASFMENLENNIVRKSNNLGNWDILSTEEFFEETRRGPRFMEFITKYKIVKFNINKNIHSEIISKLKMMNINAETLFPGLEGLGKSIKEKLMLQKDYL